MGPPSPPLFPTPSHFWMAVTGVEDMKEEDATSTSTSPSPLAKPRQILSAKEDRGIWPDLVDRGGSTFISPTPSLFQTTTTGAYVVSTFPSSTLVTVVWKRLGVGEGGGRWRGGDDVLLLVLHSRRRHLEKSWSKGKGRRRSN